MLQFEEMKLALQELEPDLKDLAEALGLESMREEIEKLDAKAAQPGFWDDMETSQKVLQRSSMLKKQNGRLRTIKKRLRGHDGVD